MSFAPRLSLACLCLALATTVAFATTFDIPTLSPQYGARIAVTSCDKDTCSGPAKVTLYRRADKATVQAFDTEDMQIMLEQAKPVVNDSRLYEDQSAIIVGDFNFDGSEDIAIRNGNNSGYGGPSYDVYVYNVTRKKFVPANDLTELASTKLGMFQVDAARKRLVTYEKDGCCWHMTTEYAVVPGKGLVDVHTVEEDARSVEEKVVVTTSDRVDGKWRRQKKTYRIKDYYKDEK
ncbi:MAG: hypothetical protein JWN73_5164 [Betaproteobacteria bacterium]|nr:hypothetical protein [Betaproteobacteria bacterium]